MYEIAVFEETVAIFKGHIFAFNVPQEAVVIPETMDGVRAVIEMQTDLLEAVGETNKYLNLR